MPITLTGEHFKTDRNTSARQRASTNRVESVAFHRPNSYHNGRKSQNADLLGTALHV